ncbi:MAG: FAD-dependent oxidoreductase [Thermodesulfobacteriota bacterium]
MTTGGSVLVLGATPAGLQAASSLAHMGVRVVIAHEGPDLMRDIHRSPERGERWLRRMLPELLYHPLVEVLSHTRVSLARDTAEGIEVELSQGPQWVLPGSCVECGRCLDACPVSLDGDRRPIFRVSTPNSVAIDKRGMAPCRLSCPLGMNVQGYVALIARGRYHEAFQLILETNPLPGVCGRVCTRPCEEACRRKELDEPLAICGLKRFVVDRVKEEAGQALSPGVSGGARIAIIGSGPAGLTAAHDLARAGFRVTLMEAGAEPGGLLRNSIAPYRLPRDVLDDEIQRILALGVDLVVNAPVTSMKSLEGQRAQGFQAVLLAMGASQDRRMGVKGEELKGVVGCVEFLERLWQGHRPPPLEKVVVVGGGNAAVEAARAAIRSGATSVTILYRRRRSDMPADPSEVRQALQEGVRLKCLALPVEFVGHKGRLRGVRCTRMRVEETDDSLRPRPVPVPGSLFRVPADTVIVAIGQGSDLPAEFASMLGSTPWGTLRVDPWGRTDVPWIFAAGDLVSGPSTVVEAMASGRKVAQAIIRFLTGAEDPVDEETTELPPLEPIAEGVKRARRRPMPHRSALERVRDFLEVVGSFSEEEALKEAKRCLQCGICSECRRCQAACELGAINHDARQPSITRLFSRVIVADPAQADPHLQGPRVIRMFTRKGTSPLKAALAGKAAAMEAIPDTLPAAVAPPSPARVSVPGEDLRTGVFICSCNRTLDPDGRLQGLLARLKGLPGVAYAGVLLSACHPERGREIEARIQSQGLSFALVASCACCPLDFACESCTDQRMRLKHRLVHQGGYDPRCLSLVNIKETCLLPFMEASDTAVELAFRLVQAELAQVGRRGAVPPLPLEPDPTILVLGATEAGLQAARGLRARNFPVVMVDCVELDQETREALRDMGAQLLWPARPTALQGQWGRFTMTVERGRAGPPQGSESNNSKGMKGLATLNWDSQGRHERQQRIRAGVVIVARQAFEEIPYKRDPFARPGMIRGVAFRGSLQTGVPGVYMASWSQVGELGLAAASEGLERYGLATQARSFRSVACVEQRLCRGCGTCAEICPEGAARMEEGQRGVASSCIDPNSCSGCGICAGTCPTGAIEMSCVPMADLEKTVHVLLG